jgi:hypothetical protein
LEAGGTAVITSNKISFAAGDSQYATNGGVSDQHITVTGSFTDSGGFLIPIGRIADSGNYIALYGFGGTMNIYVFTNNNPVSMGSAVWSYDTNPHTWELILNGSSVQVKFDGTLKITASVPVSHLHSVGVGLRGNLTNVSNFEVQQV